MIIKISLKFIWVVLEQSLIRDLKDDSHRQSQDLRQHSTNQLHYSSHLGVRGRMLVIVARHDTIFKHGFTIFVLGVCVDFYNWFTSLASLWLTSKQNLWWHVVQHTNIECPPHTKQLIFFFFPFSSTIIIGLPLHDFLLSMAILDDFLFSLE